MANLSAVQKQGGKRNYLLPSLRHHSPLKDRVSKFASSLPPKKDSVQKRPKYHQWSDLNMREAMNAVLERGVPVSKSSTTYGIPRSTLSDHIHGRVLPGVKAGAPTLLSTREEQELVDFLCNCADIGYAKTRHEVLEIVTRMLASKGVERNVTCGWWTKFISRHHEVLSLRTPSTLSIARASASTRTSMDNYFDILEHTLKTTGLSEYPNLIFNMDESGFPLDPKPLKTIHHNGSKNPYSVSTGSKSQVSIAAGQSLPPFIIWKRKSMPPDLAIGELPGTEYGLSEKGWMNGLMFHSWFRKIFLRYAPASRPLLLILDGHSSHYCPDTIQLATESEIIIFTLPPNTTHLTQPLDKGVFRPFKMHWKLVCHDYLVSHPGQVINPYNFVRLFSKAWVESMTMSNIATGFEITGIYPLNRKAFRLPGESEKETVVPNVVYTPFKRYTDSDDGIFSSSDLQRSSSPTFDLPHPPKSLSNIATLPSPKLRTVPVFSISDRISSGHTIVGLKGKETPRPEKPVLKGTKKASQCAQVQCFVCNSNGIVTFKPCGHSILCKVCAKVTQKCPTCKKPVKSFATQCLMCDRQGHVFGVKPCGHSFCRDCSNRMKNCFECRVPLESTDIDASFNLSTIDEHDDGSFSFQSDSKMPLENSFAQTFQERNVVESKVLSVDCGLFAISMAYDLCCGIDPFTQQIVQDKMRKHLMSCFEKQEISPFPKVPRQRLESRKRVVKSVSFEIHCICRGPEVLPMASCDVCKKWFHPSCLSIPEEVFEHTDVEWICPSCEPKTSQTGVSVPHSKPPVVDLHVPVDRTQPPVSEEPPLVRSSHQSKKKASWVPSVCQRPHTRSRKKN